MTEIEPGWTARLAQINERTPVETQAAHLIGAIELLGGHPMLTEAQLLVDKALRILGKWHDDGEPSRAAD